MESPALESAAMESPALESAAMESPAMESEDILAIHDLLARYGHVVDDADWSALSDVFADEAVFDLEAVGRGSAHGTEELRACFARLDHPLAHHTTNVTIEPTGHSGRGCAVSTSWSPTTARTRTGEYHDEVVHTAQGWRLQRRTVVPRRVRPRRA